MLAFYFYGAIFHYDNENAEIAFKYAVERVNLHEKNFELVPIIHHVAEGDSYKTERTVCELLQNQVAAIFGPGTAQTTGITTSICGAAEVPHIITHWDPDPMGGRERNPVQINLYPDANVLSRAYAELLIDYTWKSYTIIYENDESLMRLNDVLQIHNPQSSPISIKKLGDGPDYRPLLKEIQLMGESHIILDVSPDKIVDILRQATEVKMMEEYQSYIVTSLDAHTIDFEELKFLRSNITALRMMDPTSFDVLNAVQDWEHGEKRHGRNFRIAPELVPTEAALYHDAVKLFATAFGELYSNEPIKPIKIKCNDDVMKVWEHGVSIASYIKSKTESGITGRMIFDDEGRRTHFYLEVTELSKDGFKVIGTWDPDSGVHYKRTSEELMSQVVESLQHKVVKVASRMGAPFLTLREPVNGEILEGNNRFEGYSMDLIDAIAKQLNFTYLFELVPDGKYGSYNKVTKKWDGLVKHLLDRKADLAICDLTITYQRRTAVDFTMPFMTLGISILYAKPVKQPPNLFSFLSPLSVDVWVYTATAYMGVSILLFVLSRMSAAEWEASHPCDQEPEEVENIWNMLNCVWLTMGSIMGQGCDILPKAISTRLVAGMWWFFALIMLASYTANLAAFLTMERMDATIDSAEDLAKQTKIKYGTVEGGSTMKFFQDSNFSTYQRMWTAMESARPSVFTSSNDEGRERVRNSKRTYAFLMESTSLEYITERYCELQQIGGLLDSKGYGIAMPLNSPYRTAISGAVLKLQEEGKLQSLKEKWWKGGICQTESAAETDAAELGIDAVGGVFVVLGFGCLFAFILAILEFLWNVKNVAIEEKISPMEALKSELKFALNIWIVTKPVHRQLSNKSNASSRTQLRTESETRSIIEEKSESLGSIKVDEPSEKPSAVNNESNGNTGTSKSLLNLNKILDFGKPKRSAT